MTFLDGTTTLGTRTVSVGNATFAETFTTAGSHSLTAVYGGDANNATSTSTAQSETVNAGTTTTALASATNPTRSRMPGASCRQCDREWSNSS